VTTRSDQCGLVGVHHSHRRFDIGLDGPREFLPELVLSKGNQRLLGAGAFQNPGGRATG
jgi:hypothetical protein